MSEHTPTPWAVGSRDGYGSDPRGVTIWAPDSDWMVARTEWGLEFDPEIGTCRANAEFIALAANSHDGLLQACKAFVDYYTQAGIGDCQEGHDDDDCGDDFDGDERFNVRTARAAIAKGRGEDPVPIIDNIRQKERIKAARKALLPLRDLARKVNEEIDRETPWEEIMDLDWWRGWICIKGDLEKALEYLE